MGRVRFQWPITTKKAPDFRDPSKTIAVRTESLIYDIEEIKYERLASDYLAWKVESVVRIIFTFLAAYATYAWASYVMQKVDVVSKLDEAGKAVPITSAQQHILIALMTTTASVLGAWAIVGKYVWHVPGKDAEDKPKKKVVPPGSDEDDK